jgi:hypothetical protein
MLQAAELVDGDPGEAVLSEQARRRTEDVLSARGVAPSPTLRRRRIHQPGHRPSLTPTAAATTAATSLGRFAPGDKGCALACMRCDAHHTRVGGRPFLADSNSNGDSNGGTQ